jgi:predicted transcriptional regulator
MLRYLEEKGHLRHEQQGPRYVYMPTSSKEDVRRSALSNLVRTFFDGSVTSTVAALLEERGITGAEYERLSKLLDVARKDGE